MPHLSTLENVMVGQHCRNRGMGGVLQPVNLVPRNRWREAARAALADAGLIEYERSTVGNLPYGVQKRIELVRALMAQPRLLLLDEPAAGLNPAETEALQAQLEKICICGLTVLVVEHDMHFVGALCADVIVLDFGRKIAEGSFPPQIKLGDRAVGWKDSDVYAWMDQRERLSRDCRLRSERVRLASLRRSHFR